MQYKKRNKQGKFNISKSLLATTMAIVATLGVTSSASAKYITPSFSITVPGELTTFNKEDVLNRVNEIRKEAFDLNYFNLQKYGRFVPIKWNEKLEEDAKRRAAEASVYADHRNLVGRAPKDVEVLTWNATGRVMAGIESWYAEKNKYLKKKDYYDGLSANRPLNAGSYPAIGHYYALIDPRLNYIGVAGFKINPFIAENPGNQANGAPYTATAGILSYREPQPFTGTPITNTGIADTPIPVLPDEVGTNPNFTNLTINAPTKLGVDDTGTSSATILSTYTEYGQPWKTTVNIYKPKFVSSDPTILSVDPDGTLHPHKEGKVTLSLFLGGSEGKPNNPYAATKEITVIPGHATLDEKFPELIPVKANSIRDIQGLTDLPADKKAVYTNKIQNSPNKLLIDEVLSNARAENAAIKKEKQIVPDHANSIYFNDIMPYYQAKGIDPFNNPEAVKIQKEIYAAKTVEDIDRIYKAWRLQVGLDKPATTEPEKPTTPTTGGSEHQPTPGGTTQPTNPPTGGTTNPTPGGNQPTPGGTTGDNAGTTAPGGTTPTPETGKPDASKPTTPGGTTTTPEAGQPEKPTKPETGTGTTDTSKPETGTGTTTTPEAGKPGAGGSESKPTTGDTNKPATDKDKDKGDQPASGKVEGSTSGSTGNPTTNPSVNPPVNPTLPSVEDMLRFEKSIQGLTAQDMVTAHQIVESYQTLRQIIAAENSGPWATFGKTNLHHAGNKVENQGLTVGYDQMVGKVRLGIIGQHGTGDLTHLGGDMPIADKTTTNALGVYGVYKQDAFFVGTNLNYRWTAFDQYSSLRGFGTHIQTGLNIPVSEKFTVTPQLDFGSKITNRSELGGHVTNNYYGTTINVNYKPAPTWEVIGAFGVHRVTLGDTAVALPTSLANAFNGGKRSIAVPSRHDTWYNGEITLRHQVAGAQINASIGYDRYTNSKLRGVHYSLQGNFKF